MVDVEQYYEVGWEDDPYENLREVLAPEYTELPAEEIEAMFEAVGISAEYMEFSLGKALKSLGGVAKTVLPVAGTIVGTAFGGPVGAALGGTLGQAAAGAIPGASAGAPGRAGASGGARRPGGGSPAAAQLLQILQRPELLKGLLAMALGPAARPNVAVGSTPVPAGAFANLVGALANQASAEHHVAAGFGAEDVPGYLLDEQGVLALDAAAPEQRAARLLELLDSAVEFDIEGGWADDDLDAYYDAYDLAELVYAETAS